MRVLHIVSILLSLTLPAISVQKVLATTYYTLSSGQWSKDNSTECNCAPTSIGSGDAIIVTYDASVPGQFTVGNGATLTIISGQLTVTGNLTFNNGSTVLIQTNGSLKVNGDFENKNNSDKVTFNGSISIDGDFSNGNKSVIAVGPTATITIGGDCTNIGTVKDSSGQGYTGCNSGPLPVQLIYFDGQQQGSDVLLSWATASENGFKHFAIERSDRQLLWSEIGQVEGHGDSKIRNDYTFMDANIPLLGKIYYRLKAADFDGYSEYFNVIVVEYKGEKNLFVAPNPSTDGKITLQSNFSSESPTTVVVYNQTGEELHREKIALSNQQTLSKTFLPGLYFMFLSHGTDIKFMRVVVE
ncbi:MAG: T9SS type A sorting domain-containing protein [Chryseolinea sp.]